MSDKPGLIDAIEIARILGEDVSTNGKRQSFYRWLRGKFLTAVVRRKLKVDRGEFETWYANLATRPAGKVEDYLRV